nr:hypothetical protein CFP56_68469 [Quercus suber]
MRKITEKFLGTYKHLHILFLSDHPIWFRWLFTLDDAFFPAVHRGKRFLDCVWVRLLPMGPRDHMQERSYLTRSFCCPWGERKILRVLVRLSFMGPRVCISERTISCQL